MRIIRILCGLLTAIAAAVPRGSLSAPPPNDTPDTAVIIRASDEDVGHEVDLSEASASLDFNPCEGFAPRSVYYDLVNDATDWVVFTVEAEGAASDPGLAFFTLDDDGNRTLVACESGSDEAAISFAVPPVDDEKTARIIDALPAEQRRKVEAWQAGDDPLPKLKIRSRRFQFQCDLAVDKPSSPVGDQAVFTVSLVAKKLKLPLPRDVRVDIEVVSGPNDDVESLGNLTGFGQPFAFQYTGDGGPGSDIVRVRIFDNKTDKLITECNVVKTWVPALANDLCTNAEDIDVACGQTFTRTLDTALATVDGTDANVSPCSLTLSGIGRSVWYTYTNATASPVLVDADTLGSSYDTVINVFDRPCDDPNLFPVACNDDIENGVVVQSRVGFLVDPGATVLIQVAAPFRDAEGGNLIFTFRCSAITLACNVVPPIASRSVGEMQQVAVHVTDSLGNDVQDAIVFGQVYIGPGAAGPTPTTFAGTTDAAGMVLLQYANPALLPGTDFVQVGASRFLDAIETSCPAIRTWVDPVCSIDPAEATNPSGTSHTFTVTVLDGETPAAGIAVAAAVTSGPNTNVAIPGAVTDESGQATFAYDDGGTLVLATDTIVVSGEIDGVPFQCEAQKTWDPDLPPAPENDDCENATVVAACPFEDTVFIEGATVQAGEPNTQCGSGEGPQRRSVWYRFANAGATDELVAFTTELSNYTTVVEVYEVSGDGPCALGTVVRCLDSSTIFGAPRITFNAEAGKTYLVKVAQRQIDFASPADPQLVFRLDCGITLDVETPAVVRVDATTAIDATLERDGEPVEGAQIEFFLQGFAQCSLATDAQGMAQCVYSRDFLTVDDILVRATLSNGTVVERTAQKEWFDVFCEITPSFPSLPVGTTYIATAVYTLSTFDGDIPIEGAAVLFDVTAGPNTGETGNGVTDVEGKVVFSYAGDGGIGVDTLQSSALVEGEEVLCETSVTWTDAPANDECPDATVVDQCPFEDRVDVTNATNSISFDCGATAARDVWYVYTNGDDEPKQVTVSTVDDLNPSANTVMQLYFLPVAADLCDTLSFTPQKLRCTTSGLLGGTAAEIRFIAAPGETYAFQIGREGFDTNSIKVTVTCEASTLELVPDPILDVSPRADVLFPVDFTLLENGLPLPGVNLTIRHPAGPYSKVFFFSTTQTDANGQVFYEIDSDGTQFGTDVVIATGSVSRGGTVVPLSATARKRWIDISCDVSPDFAVNPVNAPHTATVTVLVDEVPYEGAPVEFVATDETPLIVHADEGVTGGSGTVDFTYTSAVFGLHTLRASGVVAGVPFECTAQKEWVDISCSLDPVMEVNPLGKPHTVTVTVTRNGDPAVGKTVDFEVVGGPNFGLKGLGKITDAAGQASFTYTNITKSGVDTIEASGMVDGIPFNCTAEKQWLDKPSCTLDVTPGSALAFEEQTVEVTLADGNGDPTAGVNVTFTVVGGPNLGLVAGGVTNGAGIASFAYSSELVGIDTIQASSFVGGVLTVCTEDAVWAQPPVDLWMVY